MNLFKERMKDLISREQAMLLFVYNPEEKDHKTSYQGFCEEAIFYLSKLKSAEKTGEWKRRTGRYTTGENWYRFICSECGWVIETANEAAAPYHYCPNCGSKMVE